MLTSAAYVNFIVVFEGDVCSILYYIEFYSQFKLSRATKSTAYQKSC